MNSAINVWFKPNAPIFEVRLLVNKDIAKYFIRRPLCKSQLVIKENKDGSIELVLTATSKKEMIYELKKWQPNLLVLKPKDLDKEMLEISRECYDGQVGLMI